MSTGDELKAAVSARRDLGPDYEDAVVDSFLEKMSAEIDRRVDERLAHLPTAKQAARQNTAADGMRLGLAITSLVLGTAATIVMMATGTNPAALAAIWGGVFLVNVAFNMSMSSRRR
ncbi:hypothetical protein [Nonomuraea typhae]|uniref:DUF3040 domain-containing protein n=1 Tax=Nonomuraea typhae TaxID=2603600 RepID=A0ABW7YKR4_9ACTN